MIQQAEEAHHATRVLLLATSVADRVAVCRVLTEAGIETAPCESIEHLCQKIREGAGAAIVTERGLAGEGIYAFVHTLQQQNSWSELPVVIIAERGGDASRRLLSQLGSVANPVLIERPLHSGTLIAAARSALQSRRRQYEVREQAEERQRLIDAVPVMIGYLGPDARFCFNNQACEDWFGIPRDRFVGRYLRDVLGEAAYRRARPLLERVLRGEAIERRLTVPGPDAAPRTLIVRAVPDTDRSGAVAGCYVTAMDVTRAFETEEALEQSQRMLTLAYQVVGCGTWSYELDKEVAAWSPEMFELHGLPRAPHVMAGAILEGIHTEDRTEIVRQLSEVRERRRDEWNSEYRYLHPKRGMRWLQSIGRVQRKPSGARIFGITFDVTARKEVEERSREVVASHALSAALLRGQEEERSSIARELHDDVGQRLAFVSMELDRVSADSGAMRAALRPIRDHVVQISEDIRQLSHGLRSAILEDIGLAPAIRSECGRLASFLKGLTCRFRATGALTTLPQELQLCLFRNVQEAFHNISKHSRATAIKTILKRTSRQITLTVEDNGVGFEPKSAAGGIGFSIMRERLRPFRGTLTVNSKHGCGTKVEVVIPFAGSEKVAGGKSRTGRKSVS